jgi:SOS-response transcriptional repressor LexA
MNFPEKLLKLRKSLRLSQVALGLKLGLSSTYISALENGGREPSETVANYVDLLLRAHDAGLLGDVGGDKPPIIPFPDAQGNLATLREDAGRNGHPRRIPLLGMAHAGNANAYEEIPRSWQETVPTDCRDPKAFALSLEGDSMVGQKGLSLFHGDVLVVQPSVQPYSGCIVVARFVNDGVVCRQFESAGDKLVLAPLNERFPVSEHNPDEFSWIYPVWGRWTQIWKR